MKKTKNNYENYLNEVGETLPEESFIMNGKLRHGAYGRLLRKHDPIAFEVGFNEWRENVK